MKDFNKNKNQKSKKKTKNVYIQNCEILLLRLLTMLLLILQTNLWAKFIPKAYLIKIKVCCLSKNYKENVLRKINLKSNGGNFTL